MRSYQYAVGGYYTGVEGWEFSLESYYKDMHNVLEYQDGATFFGSSGGWQEKVGTWPLFRLGDFSPEDDR